MISRKQEQKYRVVQESNNEIRIVKEHNKKYRIQSNKKLENTPIDQSRRMSGEKIRKNSEIQGIRTSLNRVPDRRMR